MDFSSMDVMMSIGFPALIGAQLGGSLLSKILNKGAEKKAGAAQDKLGKVADSEAALNNLTLKELNKLFSDIAKAEGNPQAAFTFEKFQDDPQAFMDTVMNMTGMKMRQGLLGNRGIQGGATGQLAGLTEGIAQSGAGAGGDLVQDLVMSMLLKGQLGGGGSSGGGSQGLDSSYGGLGSFLGKHNG